MVTQQVGDEIEIGMRLLNELYCYASKDKRTDIPLSELKVGLKCGGSDGFSGITANPLLGAFSDFLVSQEGTTVLTEVPEMFGAETLLMNRSLNKAVFDKVVHLINDFKLLYLRDNQPYTEILSPGNRAVGYIYILEKKSVRMYTKSGAFPFTMSLMYGDQLKVKGLNLLSAVPGNDFDCQYALAACGCSFLFFLLRKRYTFWYFCYLL